METKICPRCNSEFSSPYPRQKYCKNECAWAVEKARARANFQKEKEEKKRRESQVDIYRLTRWEQLAFYTGRISGLLCSDDIQWQLIERGYSPAKLLTLRLELNDMASKIDMEKENGPKTE